MKTLKNWRQKANVLLALALLGLSYNALPSFATQQAQKQKPNRIRCWIECCPLKITCQWGAASASAARQAGESAEVAVKSSQMTVEFKPTSEQPFYEVTQETKLDQQTAEALGFKQLTLLPGKYPISKAANGKFKVVFKVKAVEAKSTTGGAEVKGN